MVLKRVWICRFPKDASICLYHDSQNFTKMFLILVWVSCFHRGVIQTFTEFWKWSDAFGVHAARQLIFLSLPNEFTSVHFQYLKII